MGIQIINGMGNGGFAAGVNREGRILTHSVIETQDLHHTIMHQSYYEIPIHIESTTENSYFFYIENLDNHALVTSDLEISTTTDQLITIYGNVSGTPIGDDVVPVNYYLGSTESAIGVFKNGSVVTGISGGRLLKNVFLKGGESTAHLFPQDRIVLPRNSNMAFFCSNAAAEMYMNFSFYINHFDEV